MPIAVGKSLKVSLVWAGKERQGDHQFVIPAYFITFAPWPSELEKGLDLSYNRLPVKFLHIGQTTHGLGEEIGCIHVLE